MRKLARIERIDAISPIEGADAIEAAHVGGWKVVIKKGEFRPGDLAIYFEIDSFLPEGNSAWQFLIDKSARDFENRRGHVLRSVKLRGQVSQGLLLPVATLAGTHLSGAKLIPGLAVADVLGVAKYEPPIPDCLLGLVRGAYPSWIPKTDQERIQNLARELGEWQRESLEVEVTEKLEGSSCTFAWLDQDLHVCARTWDLAEADDNVMWAVARTLGIREKLAHYAGGRNLALQGEFIGPNVEHNVYRLKTHAFYLYDVYDVGAGQYLSAPHRRALATELAIPHVPVIQESFEVTPLVTMERLIEMADGPSALKPDQRREGLVFKALHKQVSFKAISNKYLLNQKF